MSTGNPFRRQRLPDETTYHDGAPIANRKLAPEDSVNVTTETDRIFTAHTIPKIKKKKRVVIQTPPHSPEEPHIPRRFSDGKTGSPPPPHTRSLDGDDTDSTTTADSDVERAALNTGRKSGSLPPSILSTSSGGQGGTRAPYNPFARTLATSEAAFGLQEATPDGTAQSQRQGGAGRPALGVDAFASILMNGSAVPFPPTGAANTSQRPQDSSSSTDTSVSQHSIFDPIHDAHPESPRTSFDYNPDDSDGENGDDEHSSLMGPVSARPVEEGPPAPPKHKHGRAFPQTVSFADFDENIPSIPTPPRIQTPPVSATTLVPPTPRSPSDLNKPLPAPPLVPTNTPSLELPHRLGPASYQPAMPAQPETQAPAKKAPPPPPTSRRRGGGSEADAGRARSESNLSQSSTQQSELRPTTSLEPANAKSAPPPPPSRRAHQSGNSPSPAIDNPPNPIPQSTPDTSTGETKAVPPPPPRRQLSTRGTSIVRTPSSASRASLPRSDSFTTNPINISGNAPPAPPPRRGAASKRNSIADHRRTSGQSFVSVSASERSADMQNGVPEETEDLEPESMVSSAATARPPSSVLADLDAFQAEIEALRTRAGGRQNVGPHPT
ncbi:hypothetical protein LTR22_025296 [Elasticomyces elasticus]|nr:hypothetical protein LTR22_025296 [Elasticomyces elasticus]